MNELAKRFSELVPDGEMSVAALQGYLLKNKTRPREVNTLRSDCWQITLNRSRRLTKLQLGS